MQSDGDSQIFSTPPHDRPTGGPYHTTVVTMENASHCRGSTCSFHRFMYSWRRNGPVVYKVNLSPIGGVYVLGVCIYNSHVSWPLLYPERALVNVLYPPSQPYFLAYGVQWLCIRKTCIIHLSFVRVFQNAQKKEGELERQENLLAAGAARPFGGGGSNPSPAVELFFAFFMWWFWDMNIILFM